MHDGNGDRTIKAKSSQSIWQRDIVCGHRYRGVIPYPFIYGHLWWGKHTKALGITIDIETNTSFSIWYCQNTSLYEPILLYLL